MKGWKNKWCYQFNDALATKNGAGKKDGMTELLTVEEGIFRQFSMNTDILSSLYYGVHNQQRPIGDMPCVAQHTTASSWKKAVNKFVEETCDIIQGHYHCHIVKNGQIYPGCLQPHGYIDYAFPLLPRWPPHQQNPGSDGNEPTTPGPGINCTVGTHQDTTCNTTSATDYRPQCHHRGGGCQSAGWGQRTWSGWGGQGNHHHEHDTGLSGSWSPDPDPEHSLFDLCHTGRS